MIESSNKSPCSRPSESLQIQVAYIIENVIVMPGYATYDKKLIVVENCSMSGTSLRNRSRNGRLSPMSRFQVEDYKIGEVGSVFVLTTKDE